MKFYLLILLLIFPNVSFAYFDGDYCAGDSGYIAVYKDTYYPPINSGKDHYDKDGLPLLTKEKALFIFRFNDGDYSISDPTIVSVAPASVSILNLKMKCFWDTIEIYANNIFYEILVKDGSKTIKKIPGGWLSGKYGLVESKISGSLYSDLIIELKPHNQINRDETYRYYLTAELGEPISHFNDKKNCVNERSDKYYQTIGMLSPCESYYIETKTRFYLKKSTESGSIIQVKLIHENTRKETID